MTTQYLQRMMDAFLEQKLDTNLSVNEDKHEELIITIGTSAQRCVLYQFLEWLVEQNDGLREVQRLRDKKRVIN